MPIYEFECDQCGERFEELLGSEADAPSCPSCGAAQTRRLISPVSPPGRQPRGARVRSDESRRGEREAARQDRIVESRKKRAAGESVRPARGKGK
ncbi:MAG: zinc ribbon domain-containing protein [Solirubrobacterales bacterium]